MASAPAALRVIRMGHPALRQIARDIPLGTDDLRLKATELGHRLHAAREKHGGVGIAAPQGDICARAVSVFVPGNPLQGRKELPEMVLFNPVLEAKCQEGRWHALSSARAALDAQIYARQQQQRKVKKSAFFHSAPVWEGCLSVPGVWGRVERLLEARADFVDARNNRWRLTATGLLAAVLQHECDHLDGVLFVDRADPRSLAFDAERTAYIREEGILSGDWTLARLP